MPRNAAKKLNNKEKECLPVSIECTSVTTITTTTAKTTTAATITITTSATETENKRNNNNTSDNIATISVTAADTLLEQQEQQKQLHTQQQQSKESPHESCDILLQQLQETSSVSTQKTTKATTNANETTKSQHYQQQQLQQEQQEVIVQFDKAADSSKIEAESTTATTTLYPTVIESLQLGNATTTAETVATLAATETTTAAVITAVSSPSASPAAITTTTPTPTTTSGQISHVVATPALLKRKAKRRRKSFSFKIVAKENCRLSTLRARKIASHVSASKQQEHDQKEAHKGQLSQSAPEADQQTHTQQQNLTIENVPTVSIAAAKAVKTTTTKTTAAPAVVCYLDAAFLNKIETLECEVKKGGNKRKRGNSLSFSLTSGLISGTRRRASTRKNSSSSNCSERREYNSASAYYSESSTAGNTCGSSSVAFHTTATTTVPTASNSKKRPRIMSLYERRYQTSDDAGRGVVSNGYLSSTRNSSAGSAAPLVHADVDTQDISNNQYYMGTPVGNAGGAAASLSGSSNAVNHAPSMATLCNIGNTCYLNSVVYTLRFAPQFLHNLHHLIVDLNAVQQSLARYRAKSSSLGRGVSALHVESARSWSSKDLAALEQHNSAHGAANAAAAAGNGGATACSLTQRSSYQLLTEKLHELYQSLHRNEVVESTEPYHADTLLHAIQDVSAIFEGNQQQDAHEFLMCLLNSIRETSQTLIKAVGECPDVIVNGYISNPDEVDAALALDKDAAANAGVNSQAASGNSATPASILSTSNITKSSFFSRKSKRKEEAKNSKNSRLQSPLKDGSGFLQQPQATSNSLFYLNTVDLSSAPTQQAQSQQPPSNNSMSKATPATSKSGAVEATSPLSLLKDKERLAEKIRELGLDFFTEDFEGITVSTTKCLSCETITEQKESMIDIAVPVPISGYDGSDYTEKPSAFIQNSCITREYFRGENKYRCEQCTGYTEAIRSISYEVLPRLLVIQLSRFSGGMEKINSYIPTSFTLQCFCAKCCELSDAHKLHVYKLYSVITHVGATMSVGHYIAYTCALDWTNEYVNCPKDRRTSAAAGSQSGGNAGSANGLHNNGGSVSASGERAYSATPSQPASAASAAASALASSGTSLIKKMKFGRSKASSSGDMSKNMKHLNGITSKAITNGIGKLSMNTTCHSLNCCATRLCTVQQQLQQQQQQLQAYKGSSGDLSEEPLPNGAQHTSGGGYTQYPTGYGSTGRGGAKNLYNSYATAAATGSSGSSSGSLVTGVLSAGGSLSGSAANAEPIWYMCDDDKIKAMTQREFEELLSPSRKITITPYLLFYARFDLHPSSSSSTSSTATQQTPSKHSSATQSSWSNESLQSGSGSSGGSMLKM